MTDLLPTAIGVGLAVSLLFSELFGLAAGGMVVPGYIALHLNNPLTVVLTLLAALATYALVYLFSSIMILYGKRRTVLTILLGYIVRMSFDALPVGSIQNLEQMLGGDFNMIGFIIPGLIAIWMDRQGLVETLAALVTASIVVRLILILAFGSELRL